MKASLEDFVRLGRTFHDVGDAQELHDILSTLPLFPFMTIEVLALCRHPSSIHADDR